MAKLAVLETKTRHVGSTSEGERAHGGELFRFLRSRGRNKIRRKPSYILFGFRGSPLAFSEALSGEEPVNAKDLPRLVRSKADIPVASLRARSGQLPLLLLTSTFQVCCCTARERLWRSSENSF
jgi:hypothetical protein